MLLQLAQFMAQMMSQSSESDDSEVLLDGSKQEDDSEVSSVDSEVSSGDSEPSSDDSDCSSMKKIMTIISNSDN
jgi:hypothetical protein